MLASHTTGHLVRRAAPAALSMAALALLTGCTLLDQPRPEPNGERSVTAEADASPVEVDDCINDPGLKSVSEISAVPCGELHDFEAFASTLMPDGDYPGVPAANTAASDFCTAEFADFVGLEYDASVLAMLYFYPTEENWDSAGDRGILCFVAEEGETPVTGSLEDAAR